ncbi:hypothetical protein [Streptomyces sp. NPDC058757]
MNSGDVTLAVAVATLLVNTVAMVAAVKAIRKPKRRGRHRRK